MKKNIWQQMQNPICKTDVLRVAKDMKVKVTDKEESGEHTV